MAALMAPGRRPHCMLYLQIKIKNETPVCKTWQGAQGDFLGRQNPALNQDAERPGAAQFLPQMR